MISATVEAELVVTNPLDRPASDIRVALALLSAGATQDAALAAFHAQPIGRPATPVFALAPGETRSARVVTALPRGAIQPMTAAGRPMFVPVVAAIAHFVAGDDAATTTRSFAVGIARDGTDKLAPFWLDMAPAMQDRVAARAQDAR